LLDAARSVFRRKPESVCLARRFGGELLNAMTLHPSLDMVAGGRVSFAGSGEERPPSVERAAGWNG
jgi:hypothetical protein